MSGDQEHVPVLLEETIAALEIQPNGFYVDATLGGGGFSSKISSLLVNGKIIAIDRDPRAIERMRSKLDEVPQIELVHGNFRDLAEMMDARGCGKADGFVFDLGLSSIQLARDEMGLSFQKDGPLDMRFDPDSGERTAADLLKTVREKELADLFWKYGETRSRRIAKAIVSGREREPLETTKQLSELICRVVPGRKRKRHPATKVFLALRCEVNGELEALERAIPAAIERSKPGARIAIISYHSLEDRIVKDKFRRAEKGCKCDLPYEHCICTGKPAVRWINKKGITPSKEELERNKRARSGKLRVVERTEH